MQSSFVSFARSHVHLPRTQNQAYRPSPADTCRVLRGDETSNGANPSRIPLTHVAPGCHGYNPHAVHNPGRRASRVPKSAAAILPAPLWQSGPSSPARGSLCRSGLRRKMLLFMVAFTAISHSLSASGGGRGTSELSRAPSLRRGSPDQAGTVAPRKGRGRGGSPGTYRPGPRRRVSSRLKMTL